MIAVVTNHLWQSTVCAVVAGLTAAALRNNSAPIRYWIWLAASVKFLVPFSILVVLGSHLRWAPGMTAIASERIAKISVAMQQIAEPLSDPSPSAAIQQPASEWSFVIFSIWICGSAAVGLTRVRDGRRIRAAVRTSTPLTISGVSIPVRSAAGLLEPGVVGLWRPILLLPAGIEKWLMPVHLEALLAHELWHVRRRDNLTAAMHMIVEAAFWFHPLVWWIGARLVDERERACDEQVLRISTQPEIYAEAIVRVCRLYVESPLACVSGVTGSNVKRRIEDIMINRIGLELNFARKTSLAFVGTVILTAPVIVGMMSAPLRAATGIANAAPPQSPRSGQPTARIQRNEAMLKGALFQIRAAIDRYYADKKEYPANLDSLVSAGYLKTIPKDPFTSRATSWQAISPKPDPANPRAPRGIADVRSGSTASAANGTKYSDW